MRNVILKALPATTFGKFKIVSVSDAIEIAVTHPTAAKEELRRVGQSISEEQARIVCANSNYNVRVIA